MSRSTSPTQQLNASGKYWPNNQEELSPDNELLVCSSCGQEKCDGLCQEQPEQDSDSPVFVKARTRMPWQQRPDKTILQHAKRRHLFCEEDAADAIDSLEKAEPDLYGYLSQFEMSEPQMVGLCRTFANYLASKQRAIKPPKQVRQANNFQKHRKVDIDLCDE